MVMKLQTLQSDSVVRSVRVAAVSHQRTLPRVLSVFNVNPAEKFGSLEEQIVFLHRRFRAEGSQYLPLFTFPAQAGKTDGFRERGVEVHCLDLQGFRWNALRALRELIAKQGIELVHWQFTDPLSNPYLWWLSVFCPTVRHFYTDRISRLNQPYTPPVGWRRWLKRLLLHRYTQTWCVSQFVQDRLDEQGTWSNVRVCPHFINTDRFAPDPFVRDRMRHQFDVEDRFVVTVIAQLIHEKGIDVLLRAMRDLPEKTMLWIIGSGKQAEELRLLSQTLGIDHRVCFLGLQRHVEPFLQASDCFVLPSRWKEAAGLVILEAQATGLPVVASRIGGIPEYLDENRTGFLFASENAQELAGHVRALCQDAELCRRMGQQARSLAVKRFSPASQMSQWLDNYRR
jgi:glycosyltransferase involved in cell wall biosynthesis